MYSDFCFIFLIQHSLNKTGLISVSIGSADYNLYQIARLGAGPSRLLQVNGTLIIEYFPYASVGYSIASVAVTSILCSYFELEVFTC